MSKPCTEYVQSLYRITSMRSLVFFLALASALVGLSGALRLQNGVIMDGNGPIQLKGLNSFGFNNGRT